MKTLRSSLFGIGGMALIVGLLFLVAVVLMIAGEAWEALGLSPASFEAIVGVLAIALVVWAYILSPSARRYRERLAREERERRERLERWEEKVRADGRPGRYDAEGNWIGR